MRVCEEAKQILSHTERAVRKTQQAARGEVGQLRLSFTASALRSILPKIMPVFRERYPDVQLTMNECCTHSQVVAFSIERLSAYSTTFFDR
ncbi:MAG: LysR substrate-binding domain-containing protein [Leptolyngbyaceae cyanobacterium]